MKDKYLIGVDVGTQSAKVVIFDLQGNIVAQAGQPLRKMEIPAPQLMEHPDDDLWEAMKIASNKAMSRFRDDFGGRDEDILAVGICIIRCCQVLLRPDGNLAWPVINWMDKRMNSPYKYEEKYGEVGWVTTTSGYITHRLTGQFKDTCANYIGWWPIDDVTLDWSTDDKLVERCNVPRDMLLDLVKPGEVLGTITEAAAEATGYPAGLPVVATAHDKAVEALGSGSLDDNTALVSLGTYIGAMVNGPKHIFDAKSFWSFQASIPGRYIYECPGVRSGMWTISWFCDEFGGDEVEGARREGIPIEEVFNRQGEEVPAGCEGLITIHDWTAPVENFYRKGAMLGFDGRHTRAHIYRSILEGIAFRVKSHVDKMVEEQGIDLKRLIISGGGSNSDLFVQIFADLFGLPTSRNEMNGAASLGCAINAAMAVSAFDNYEQATAAMVRPGQSFTPNADNHDIYSRIFDQVYTGIHQHLDPIFQPLSPLVD